jgi:hypothetical protein
VRSAGDVLESLGAAICPHCGRAGDLLARIPCDVQERGLVTITPATDIDGFNWHDGIVSEPTESFREVWGHIASSAAS